jgi:RNase P protein component
MLPKRSRLGAHEVKEVLARGTSMRIGRFAGKYLPGRTPLGVAVIVSKKTARLATRRNSLRRAAYRELRGLELPRAGSLALFVRPSAI